MKKAKKKLGHFFKTHFNQLLLSFYFGTVLNIFIFLLASDYISSEPPYVLALIAIFLLVYLLSFFLYSFVIKKIAPIKLHPVSTPLNQKQKLKILFIFFIFFFFSLLVSLFWFLAYNPGGYSPDSAFQYEQAITGEYTDWHPAIHTFLFFTIPLSIFHNISAIIVCQIILFSTVLAYSATTIFELTSKKWSIITFLLIILNPWILDQLMFPWTNVAFGIMTLLITTFCLKIYHTKGNWIKKLPNLILLSIAITLATLFRHNGVLYTIPIITFLFFFIQKKDWMKLFLIIIISIFLIKVPLYSLLNVAPADSRTTETVGLPMTILANITKETPETLDEDTTSLMYSIASPEKYETEYTAGDFNSIKFSSNLTPIEEAGTSKILHYAFNAFFKSPKASLTALFRLTEVVYKIDGTLPLHNTPHINATITNPDITYHGISFFKSAIDLYRGIFRNSILKYFGSIGVTILLMLTFILGKNHWTHSGWKKILLCSPIIIYDFCTMLLLTGPEPRLFFANFLVYPSIITLSILNQKRAS